MYDNMAKQPAGDKKVLDISLYKDNTKKGNLVFCLICV